MFILGYHYLIINFDYWRSEIKYKDMNVDVVKMNSTKLISGCSSHDITKVISFILNDKVYFVITFFEGLVKDTPNYKTAFLYNLPFKNYKL